MVIALTLYSVETPESYESIMERFSDIDTVETTTNESTLRTRAGSIEELDDYIFYAPLHYQNEVYFKIEGKDTWLVTDESIGIGFIGSNNLIAFAPKNAGGDRSANLLNRILFDNETKIRNQYFSEEFMIEFMNQNPAQMNLGFLTDLTLPNAYGQSIMGGDVKKSIIYRQALGYGGRHGYVLLSLISDSIVIGLSKRKATIVFYNKLNAAYMLEFIRDRILTLL